MRELDRPIGRVWRRLRFQRFLSALVWCWAAGLALVAVTVAVGKFGAARVPGADWWPFAIAGGAGLIVAALIAACTGPSRVDAAVALDHSFHLNERLSTALTLPDDLRDTPAGRALIADALRHVGDLDIGSQFGPRFPRLAWIPVIPAAVAAALLFVPQLTQTKAQARIADTIEKQVVVDQSKALGKKIAEQRKEMDKSKFAEAEKILAEIERAADQLAKAPPGQKDKALVELNKLTDTLKDRQKQLGSPEQINRQLQQLKDLAKMGPGDEFTKSLAKGDFMKAATELKKLQEKLKSGKMTEAEKKQLKEQVAEMAKKLEKLANLDQRKQQLAEALKNGGLSKEQFQKEMQKLEEQAKSLQQLQNLAAKLDEAQKQLEKGNAKEAAKALGMTEEQLAEMAKQLQEIEALDGALADLQDAKNGMTGDGMNQLGDALDNLGMRGDRRNRMGKGSGNRGRGEGDRPEAPDSTSSYTAKTKLQANKGKAVMQGFAPPQSPFKGQSVLDIQQEIATSEGLSADALSNQKIPKTVEKHVRGYFDQLNKGK